MKRSAKVKPRRTERERFEEWRKQAWPTWPSDWTPEHALCMWFGWQAAKRQSARERSLKTKGDRK